MSDKQQPSLDRNGLYLEEIFTDRTVGTIRRLTPVDAEGRPDASRATIYAGSAQMMTPAGPLPLNFDIEAASLGEAADNFTRFAEEAMRETIRELQELRREQASSIVLPGNERAAIPGGLAGPGGLKLR
jgi:hypothetical protein